MALSKPIVSASFSYETLEENIVEEIDAWKIKIEHSILRKEFDEPRIHFAINCASVSCPPLLNEAFVPEKLEAQSQQLEPSA